MGVLDDVSVVELAIASAAPSCARALAFHGADVVKIESRTNPDVMRLFGAVWAREMDPALYMDSSPYLGEMCANKRSVGLDLKQPDGRDAALALLATADVFITNYSTPAMRTLGFGYEDVAAVNPTIIYVAMPGFGSDATRFVNSPEGRQARRRGINTRVVQAGIVRVGDAVSKIDTK